MIGRTGLLALVLGVGAGILQPAVASAHDRCDRDRYTANRYDPSGYYGNAGYYGGYYTGGPFGDRGYYNRYRNDGDWRRDEERRERERWERHRREWREHHRDDDRDDWYDRDRR